MFIEHVWRYSGHGNIIIATSVAFFYLYIYLYLLNFYFTWGHSFFVFLSDALHVKRHRAYLLCLPNSPSDFL